VAGVQQQQDSSWKSLDPPHVGVHSHCSGSSQKFVMEAEALFEGEDYVVRELDVYLAGASSEDNKARASLAAAFRRRPIDQPGARRHGE
jgi:hypothetical protein